MKNRIRGVLQALVVASAMVVPAIGSAADDDPPFRELSAQWWQWALSIPTTDNPLLDATGSKCMVGQRGPIWFLAGTFGGTVSRSCSVPQGATLFFPIVNNVIVNTPGFCQVGPYSVATIRELIAPFIDGITATTVTVDSVAVRGVRRVKSAPFAAALPVDNLFAGCPDGQPPGVFSPSADDGYYVKIDGLKAGTHTLQFTATNPSVGFNLNVTYVLDVVPVSLR